MNATLPTPDALRAALAGLLDGLPPTKAAQAVDRLIASYRGTTPTDAPVLRDRADVAAYAAYRMPATFEAVRSALAALRDAAPAWRPATHTDVGGGTGAASWAVAEAWGGEEDGETRDGTEPGGDGPGGSGPGGDGPGSEGHADTAGTDADRLRQSPQSPQTSQAPQSPRTTVLDWAEPALALGRELAAASGVPGLRAAQWRRARVGGALTLDPVDLVTVSYVLKELTEADRAALVGAAARAAEAVVIVEPGTPDGYERIIAARDLLIGAGLRIAAPCPHSAACPIEPGSDWCHFSARVSRSSLHRQVKGGSLAYEDEKFAYVAAVRFPAEPAAARVTRRPQIRKGQVLLDLCSEGGGLRRDTVTKRHGGLYKGARDAEWGDPWPPA
ncbi:small ribosomal subunit Rsm22 family protein [Streptomyces fradiae]|uniref:small ribosomal subunit Rsm22 family protein n=1 Tax=Streptomyces fradiae TaxID=1906 RepID=UPI0035BE1B1B